MMYAEAAFFDGNHCAHVAAYQEARRVEARRAQARDMLQRRRGAL